MSTIEVRILEKAFTEFRNFSKPVRTKFAFIFNAIESGFGNRNIPRSKFKKLSGNEIFEARVKHNGQVYRGLSAFVGSNLISVVFLKKKSQKLPIKELNKAMRRFELYQHYLQQNENNKSKTIDRKRVPNP